MLLSNMEEFVFARIGRMTPENRKYFTSNEYNVYIQCGSTLLKRKNDAIGVQICSSIF